jgi:hypothetical protein
MGMVLSSSEHIEFLCGSCGGSVLLEVLGDPRHEVGDPGIYAWIFTLTTSNAPAHDAHLGPFAIIHHQRTSAVTLEWR